ncbi:hypothetical protein DFH08DRAFT_1018498 [Mycena albidolilacea]|uniref:DUF6534 domain-containing protein n=1 Tax=Mycena albidolilacea TaxID=1033008 RepID=A0AAD6ZRI1_9AGAR|nr:hypothetical protein DFH08DRAFT_1018498 [Mycena albidolilacea]
MNSPTSQIAPNNIGAYEIGVLLSCVLFGVTTTQTYIYYSRFADDSRKLKSLVALVWVCEFAHALCIGHTLYFYTISGDNHPDAIQVQTSPRTLLAGFSITACIVACVQAFFGFRIYMLSKRLCIPVLIWIVAFLRLSLFTLSTVVTDTTMEESFILITSAWVVGVANDLLITITLVFLLRRQRKDVHKRTMVLADKIIAWTIETGMITSAAAIVELICLLAMPLSWIWIAIFTIEARLFANSFLASLNGRTKLRAMSDAPLTFTMPPIGSFSNGVQMTNVRPNVSDVEVNPGLGDKEASSDVYCVQVESQIK